MYSVDDGSNIDVGIEGESDASINNAETRGATKGLKGNSIHVGCHGHTWQWIGRY